MTTDSVTDRDGNGETLGSRRAPFAVPSRTSKLVNVGWSTRSWYRELKRKEKCCRAEHPKIAAVYTEWMDDIELAVKNGQITP